MAQQNDGNMVVTYSSLEEAAIVIGKQADRLDQTLEAIQRKIKGVSATFEGEAKTAADTAHKKWDDETRKIHEALKGIAKAVHDAGPLYKSGDLKSASHFHNMG
ncbi:WXG100 family type VII secretion target [Streptomyces sp. NBC_01481]|uniref:WXG100 family type VII secretion target n=1 Tax=Streptomyces sp. NBC_01481 TaxID=2975869 RepID=UPI002253648B|nr:WXG100 family type VII secretion target [Streptomyces sp. NBC_01481]MCX4587789.1 WXG100 family type VII secretion target [Streptomyces sp. NBC_01481]